MRKLKELLWIAVIFLYLLYFPSPVLADNCSGLSDCFSGNMMPAILLLLGLLLLAVVGWYLWPLILRFALGAALRGLASTAARSRIATAIGRSLSRLFGNRSLQFSAKQLQKKFTKHAADFGIKGNYNSANAKLFGKAIQSHVKNRATQVIKGTYRGENVTHFYNPKTGLNVIKDANGNFLSGWKLNPTQIQHLLKSGKLGGG